MNALLNRIQVTSPLHLLQEDVLLLLKSGNDDFVPPLESIVNLTSYSIKLSDNASFILAKYGNHNVGCIAFYCNNEGQFIYISHFWVSHLFQKQHVGSRMLDKLVYSVNGRYVDLILEVLKDNSALMFYKKKGFVVKEDRGDKYLLILCIKDYVLV